MQTRRLIGLILIVIGSVLLVMGVRAIESFGSQLSQFFTGSPTDRAIWLTLGGIVSLIAGAAAAFLPSSAARG